METLITCKETYEKTLAKEAALHQGTPQASGRGVVIVNWGDAPLPDLCFANHILKNPVPTSNASVNGMTEQLLNLFCEHIKGKRVTSSWPAVFASCGDEKLLRRVQAIEKNWLDNLRRKLSRVAKLATNNIPAGSNWIEGFFVYFINFEEAFVSFQAIGARQQRMRMDPLAPSRSYLKAEEAFYVFGCEPKKGDTVIDLGAAPGGWSYSALKRGARVTAIDNGPLKGAVANHPKITHLKEDAFKYKHENLRPVEWMFCDILEQPDMVLECLREWLRRKWCRRFIVNLKVGRNDPIRLLQDIRDPRQKIISCCRSLQIKQLYHDREEITLMGEAKKF